MRPLLRRLKAALPLFPRPLPPELKEVSITLVDRATIAHTHRDFLGDPTETDVITFPYGEIVVCPAVAQEQAPRYRRKVVDEVLLYGLHGLLHLAGYDDLTPRDAARMAQVQERLLRQVLKGDASAD